MAYNAEHGSYRRSFRFSLLAMWGLIRSSKYPDWFRTLNMRSSCKSSMEQLTNSTCWSCGSDLKPAKLICGCGAVLPAPRCTYFDLFDVAPTLDFPEGLLEKRFHDLQRSLHPDKFGQRSKKERELSSTNSALINVAYQTLRDPMERLRYALELEGITFAADVSTPGTEFLWKMMERRQAIESGLSKGDLEVLISANQKEMEQVFRELKDKFAVRNLESIAYFAGKLKYLTAIDGSAKSALDLANAK